LNGFRVTGSRPRFRAPRWIAFVGPLAAVTIVLYSWKLDQAPVHLTHDEVFFALHAESVAVNGTDLNGRFLPVFFSDRTYEAGREPLSIYLTALVLKLLPLSETAIRLPAVLVGVIDVILMFFVSRTVLGSAALALAAAALLALCPAHLFYSRLALDVVYPLPFLLGWLWLFLRFEEQARPWLLFASTFVLSLGVYGYASAELTSPAYLLLTCAVIVLGRHSHPRRVCAIAIAGFAVGLLPFVAWHLVHPERYHDVIRAYAIYDAKLSPLQGARDLATYRSIGDRVGAYWNSLSPSFLYFFGDSSVPDSTRRAGVFLLPTFALLGGGLYSFIRGPRSNTSWTIVAGFFLAPLAAIVEPVVATRRILAIVPFGILIAMYGWRLFASRFKYGPHLVALTCALSLYHFVAFYADYLTEYRLRSAE